MLKGNGIHSVWFYISAGLFCAGFILFLAAFSSSFWTWYPGEHGHFGIWECDTFGKKTETMKCLSDVCPVFSEYATDRSSACSVVSIIQQISLEDCLVSACQVKANVFDYLEEEKRAGRMSPSECHIKNCSTDELPKNLKLWEHTDWKVFTSIGQKTNHVQALQGLVILCFLLVIATLLTYIFMFLKIWKESKSESTLHMYLLRTEIKVLVGFQAMAGVVLGTVVMIHGLSNTKPAQSIGWSFIVAIVCALLFGLNGAAANFIRKPQWNNNIKRPLTSDDPLDIRRY